MKQVKCKSGLIGWQEKLRNLYNGYEEFTNYCEWYMIHIRLGYTTIEEAWYANPTIQGSTEPSDLKVVKNTSK